MAIKASSLHLQSVTAFPVRYSPSSSSITYDLNCQLYQKSELHSFTCTSFVLIICPLFWFHHRQILRWNCQDVYKECMQNVNLIWISLCSRVHTMASPNSSLVPVSCRQLLDLRVQCLGDPCHYPRGPCLKILAWCLRCPQIRCPSTHRVTCLKDLVVSLTGKQSASSHVNS